MKALIGLGVVVAIIGMVFMMYVSASNGEVRLRNAVTAQQKANETSFDTCWKIISQQAQLTDKYKDAFKDIYTGLMEGRHYEKGGALFKFVMESNPKFDTKLFLKLATSIESQRTVFKRDQQKLIDLKREHDNMLTTIPSSWFVGSRPPVEIKIVTSTRTTESFNSGKEDDVELTPKK